MSFSELVPVDVYTVAIKYAVLINKGIDDTVR